MPPIRSLLPAIAAALTAPSAGAPRGRRRTARVLLLAGLALLAGQPVLGQSKVFWITNGNATILEAELDGSNQATVYEGIPAINGMDVDAGAGKVYWVDGVLGKIFRADTTGTSQEELVSGLTGPADVALDLTNSKMYWTDLNAGEIGRANLDGTIVETLISDFTTAPTAIAVDPGGGKFYWTDNNNGEVRRANLDGSSDAAIVSGLFAGVSGVALDLTNSKVYWIDALGSIDRANLDGSAPDNGHILETGDFIAVDAAGSKVYWTDQFGQRVARANLDGTGVEDILTGLTGPVGIGLDLTNSKVYWTDPSSADRMRRADLDGSNSEAILTPEIASAGDLDVYDGKIYWTDNGSGEIRRANVDFTSPEDLVTGLTTPIGIRIDENAEKMYWIDQGTLKIQRANLDGTTIEDLISAGLSEPRHLDLDVAGGKMYWTDGTDGEIRSANLDGSGAAAVVTGLLDPFGVAVGSLYWADNDKIQTSDNDGSNQSDVVTGLLTPHGVVLDASAGKLYYLDSGTGQLRRVDTDGSNDELLVSGLFGPTDLALAIEANVLTESTAAVGLSGAGFADPDGEAQVFSIGITGNGISTVNSIAVTIEDLSAATGLAAGDFAELRLYTSTDATLDGGDTQIGDQTTVNIGSATTITADTPDTPADGTEVFYLVSAVIASAPTGGHAFKVGFAANGVTTSDGTLGSAVTSADADRVTILRLVESTAAAGLSGASTANPNAEVQVFSIGITGDGVSAVDAVGIELQDLSAATGLAAADIAELRLYTSTDAILDGGDTQIGDETTVNIGSATGVLADVPNVPGAGTEVFYLVAAVIASSPTGGHAFRVEFTAGDVVTSNVFGPAPLGTGVSAADANRVTILRLTQSTAAAGLSGASTADPDDEVQIFSIGITGDGVSTVSSIDITLEDLSSATGMASSDIAELRLYSSTDATLDGGDTQIGDQTAVNIGSATTISADTPDVPGAGAEVFYLISAVIASGPQGGHAFRVGFAANDVTTSFASLGTAVASADADRVTIRRLTESTGAIGLSGSSTADPDDEVQIFSIGITGDGVSTVNSIDITLSDLTSATGLAAGDLAELRLYSSADATLDGGDTQIGDETSVSIGSATTVSADTPDTPGLGTEVFYLISAVISSSPTGGHAFRVGFAANGVTASGASLGSAVTAADADRVTILRITESTAAAGLSGASTAPPNGEVQVFRVGITGDGVSSVNSIDITLSDLTSATGLAGADFAELRLYSSTDATLDGGDTQIGDETSVNIGSATTVSADTPDVPGAGTEVFYLISAVVASNPTDGHAFRIGFATGDVATSQSPLGTAVAAADADRVTIQLVAESTVAAGLSGASAAAPDGEVQVFSIGVTGDGVSTVSSIAITLSDLTAATGLAAADIAELRLYTSTDATLDGGDTQIGDETSVNIGSATTVSADTPDTPGLGTEVFYLISAVIASNPTDGHAFRVGFAAGGVTTSVNTLGTAVTAADADRVTITVGVTQLVFTTQPVNTTHLGALTVVVEGRDNLNVTDPTFVDPITLTVSPAGTLTGGTVAAVNGVATFNLTISGAGTGLTLAASGGGLTATSNSFNVAKAPATVTLSNLVAAYSGEPQAPVAATDPDGLTLTVTYDGDPTVPVNPGRYAVVATVSDADFTGSATANFLIEAPPPPTADLRASATTGLAPLKVTFTDQSSGFISQRVLEHGDQARSRAINAEGPVVFTYDTPGAFTAALFLRGLGGRNEARLPITVYGLLPVAEQTIDELQSLTIALLASAASEVVELTVEPQLPRARIENGEWHWTPDFSQSGTHSLTVTATDGLGTRQTQSFDILVNDLYELLPIEDQTVGEGENLTVELLPASALEALQLTVEPQLPGVRLEDGQLHWIPDYEQAGTHALTVTATDVLGTTQTQTVTILVSESPPPVLATAPAALDFGNVLAGRTVESSFDLSNPSPLPLIVDGFEVGAPAFVVLPPELPVTIASGDLATFQVRFAAELGARPLVTTLETSTSLGPIVTPMAGRSLWAALEPDTQVLNFGTVLPGESAQLRFNVDNPGTIPVRGVVDIDEPSFAVAPQRFTVEAGLSQRFTVTFSPVRAENHVASLRFLDVEPVVGPTLDIDPIPVDGPGTIPVRGAAGEDEPAVDGPQRSTVEPGLTREPAETPSPVRAKIYDASLRFVDVPIPVLGFASGLAQADFNRDRVVDMEDFFAFADAVFHELTPANAAFDLTRDGRIDFADLFRFADAFGEVTPLILARSADLDPASREHVELYGRAIRSLTADLGRNALRAGEVVRHSQSGMAAELVIDIGVPADLETLHVESGEAARDRLSAELVIAGASRLPAGLTTETDRPETRPPAAPITAGPVGFVTADGESLAVHGNVITLPRARARFDFGRLRSSGEPTLQEEIQRNREVRPALPQEAVDVLCSGRTFVSVDRVFSELYDSAASGGAAVGELHWILATNSVTYDCQTQRYAAAFMLQYLHEVRRGNEPVMSEAFIVSESLQ